MLSGPRALMSGIPTLIGESLTTTGTTQVRSFSVVKNPMASGRVTFQFYGTVVALDGNIECSANGGTTWTLFQGFDFIISPIIDMIANSGFIYRFNISTVTTPVGLNILATLS